MENLRCEIEYLRHEMHVTAYIKGISHPDVLRISQKLDAVINEFCKLELLKKVV